MYVYMYIYLKGVQSYLWMVKIARFGVVSRNEHISAFLSFLSDQSSPIQKWKGFI